MRSAPAHDLCRRCSWQSIRFHRIVRSRFTEEPMTMRERGVAALTIQERTDVAPITDLDLSDAVQSDACVLFTGDHESAEALARRLHALSGWRYGPFVAVDCALPDAAPRLMQLRAVE